MANFSFKNFKKCAFARLMAHQNKHILFLVNNNNKKRDVALDNKVRMRKSKQQEIPSCKYYYSSFWYEALVEKPCFEFKGVKNHFWTIRGLLNLKKNKSRIQTCIYEVWFLQFISGVSYLRFFLMSTFKP